MSQTSERWTTFFWCGLPQTQTSEAVLPTEAVVHNPDMDWKELKMPHILLRPCSESVWHLHQELYLRWLTWPSPAKERLYVSEHVGSGMLCEDAPILPTEMYFQAHNLLVRRGGDGYSWFMASHICPVITTSQTCTMCHKTCRVESRLILTWQCQKSSSLSRDADLHLSPGVILDLTSLPAMPASPRQTQTHPPKNEHVQTLFSTPP